MQVYPRSGAKRSNPADSSVFSVVARCFSKLAA